MKIFYIWITMRCYYAFLSIDVSLFFTRYSLRHLPLKFFYFIHQIVVIVQSIWHSLSLRNNLLVLARQITAIVLLAKPFGSEKLNKRDFILLSSCF